MSWINIDDQLPPFGELVWVYGGNAGITLAERTEAYGTWAWSVINDPFFSRHEDRIEVDTCFDDINPTHWHPLPVLPPLKNIMTISKQVDSAGNFEQAGYTPGGIAAPTDRGWWCPACEEPLEPKDVTFEEFHDVRRGGCGGKVIIKKHEP